MAQKEEKLDSNDMLKSLFARRDSLTAKGSRSGTPGLDLGDLMKDQVMYSSEKNSIFNTKGGPSRMSDRKRRSLANALSVFATPNPGKGGTLPRKGSDDTRGNFANAPGGSQPLGLPGNSLPARVGSVDSPNHRAQPPNNPNSGFGPLYFFSD